MNQKYVSSTAVLISFLTFSSFAQADLNQCLGLFSSRSLTGASLQSLLNEASSYTQSPVSWVQRGTYIDLTSSTVFFKLSSNGTVKKIIPNASYATNTLINDQFLVGTNTGDIYLVNLSSSPHTVKVYNPLVQMYGADHAPKLRIIKLEFRPLIKIDKRDPKGKAQIIDTTSGSIVVTYDRGSGIESTHEFPVDDLIHYGTRNSPQPID